MTHFRRILAIALTLVLLTVGLASAAGTLIVSPTQNSITDTDTLLVSVKLTEKEKIRVTVFQEMTAVKLETPTEDGKNYEYVSVDVSLFTEDDLALIAAGKFKDEAGNDVLLSDGSKMIAYSDVVFAEAAIYENTKSVGFYTKQFSGLKPGLYKVKVEVLGAEDKVTDTVFNLIAVKEKAAEGDVFTTAANGTLKNTIQNIINKIFK